MHKTDFFFDFVDYYRKAKLLEERNLLLHDQLTGDPLMDHVTIYDTVHRRQAGFSKALEDVHGVRQRKDLVRYADFSKKLSVDQFHFLHLFHRFTGSGASFQPTFLQDGTRNPKEHGYLNNHVEKLAAMLEIGGWDQARRYIVECQTPMVTSVGNQPPSIKNGDPTKYRLAQQYYFDNFAVDFVNDYVNHLQGKQRIGIKEGVDYSLAWHKQRDFKQWHFVLTAFVMDTAEYYPELVDPSSHCYYGANCVRAFELCFTREADDPKNKAAFQEQCMATLCEAVDGNPYDVEDVCCDYIRYLVEYLPKGYTHLLDEERVNNSSLKVQGKYPFKIQDRINQIIN